VSLWVLLLCAIGVLALVPVGGDRRRKAAQRSLIAMPETPIAAIKDGETVRIRGRAVARESLVTSPVSQVRCIGYRLTIDWSDSAIEGWRQITEEDGFGSLVLADDTGEAVIHPPFDIRLKPHRERLVAAASPALASLLDRNGIRPSDVFGMLRSFRCAETIVMPGDDLIAVGRATIEIDQGGRAPSPRAMPVMCHLKGGDKPVVLAAPE